MYTVQLKARRKTLQYFCIIFMAHLLYWSPFAHEKAASFFIVVVLFRLRFPCEQHKLQFVFGTNIFRIIIIPFALICCSCWSCCCCCCWCAFCAVPWMLDRMESGNHYMHCNLIRTHAINARAIFDFHLHSTSCNAPIRCTYFIFSLARHVQFISWYV